MNISIEDLLDYMLELFNNTSKNLINESEKQSQKDKELSDLDHYLEIHKLKSYEHASLSKLRQTVREERRDIKDNVDILTEIKKFTDKYNNKFIVKDIIQLKKGIKTIKTRQENPCYTYKTNILERLENAKDKNTIALQEQEKQSTNILE